MIDHRLRQNNFENPVLGLAKNSFRTPRMFSDRDDEVLLGEGSSLLDRLVLRQSQALQRAEALYRAVSFAGQISCLFSWLARRPNFLIDASELGYEKNTSYTVMGLREVSINHIISSETGRDDFDLAFHPLRDENRNRWINLATVRFLGIELPPVSLIQVRDFYIVRDGLHRISVNRALGQDSINACVTFLQDQ